MDHVTTKLISERMSPLLMGASCFSSKKGKEWNASNAKVNCTELKKDLRSQMGKIYQTKMIFQKSQWLK